MKRGSDSSVHGSLMTFGEMLLSSGAYLSPKLPTVYDFVLEHRHRRDANIRKSVLDLIPKLANYRPRYFIQNHMSICLKYVMKKCHSNSERGDASCVGSHRNFCGRVDCSAHEGYHALTSKSSAMKILLSSSTSLYFHACKSNTEHDVSQARLRDARTFGEHVLGRSCTETDRGVERDYGSV